MIGMMPFGEITADTVQIGGTQIFSELKFFQDPFGLRNAVLDDHVDVG